MPNGKVHKIIGTGAGVATSLCFTDGQPGLDRTIQAVGAGLGGYVGAKLPDIIEPATSPRHRQFAHSLVCNVSIAAAGYAAVETFHQNVQNLAEKIRQEINASQDPVSKFGWSVLLFFVLLGSGFVVGTLAGYLSHIAADSLTPASIPII